jgi:hypothetical protein
MADLNLTNVTLTDNDLIDLVDRIYPEDFISSKPWIQLDSEFYGSNKNLISIFNNTLLDKIEIATTKSNNVLNLFIQTYGNASLGGIKEDFDNIKANLFSESDNINGIGSRYL